jgi:hypothetical protein
MTTSVIVEGETDQHFLWAVLGAAVARGTEIVSAGGRSSAISLARSYLSLPDRTVALLLDADTSDERLIEEQRGILSSSLAAVAPEWRFKVFLAVPVIEACLFSTSQVAAAAFGSPLSSEVLLRGRYEPRRTLVELAQRTGLLSGGNPQGHANYTAALATVLSRPQLPAALALCSPFAELKAFIEDSPHAEWVARGFLWPKSTALSLPDGSEIVVAPWMHRSSLLKNAQTERQRSTLRFYRVTDQHGRDLGEQSELDILKSLGQA